MLYLQAMVVLFRTCAILFGITLMQMAATIPTYGQVDEDDIFILLKAFREVTSQEQIFYVDTVNKDTTIPEPIREVFQKGKIIDAKKSGQINSLRLTKAEKKYLLEQIGKTTILEENFFVGSKRIDSDSIWVFLKKENTRRVTSINQAALNGDTLSYKKLNYHYSYVFSFSKPIYIRDKTVCLISFVAMCGVNCGREETSFYRKENNEWKKWIVVSAGDY